MGSDVDYAALNALYPSKCPECGHGDQLHDKDGTGYPCRGAADCRCTLNVCGASTGALRAEAATLRAFKAYVHQRLDEAGVPTHPDGPHSKEGCRIGDRLDLVFARVAHLEAAVAVERGLAQDAEGRWTAAAADRDRLRARVREARELVAEWLMLVRWHVYADHPSDTVRFPKASVDELIDATDVAEARTRAFLAREDGTP